MATRYIDFAPGEFYHVYNRGTDKRIIFTDSIDYRRFVDLMYLCNSSLSVNVRNARRSSENVFEFEREEALVSIGAYCLMPNHFHILITPNIDGGLSTFMNKLGTSYSMYFNKRHSRTGSLFEGTYKAKHASTDEYIKYLYAYIHLNPVKLYQPDWKERGIKDKEDAFRYVSNFEYSSLPDYLNNNRPEMSILNKESFPDYFDSHIDIKADLFDWLSNDVEMQ